MDTAALDKMLLKLKEKNKNNPFFESMKESYLKRCQKDECGEFFRITEKYIELSREDKKKIVNLGIVSRKAIEQKKRNLKILFYSLNGEKRKLGLRSGDIPGRKNFNHKLTME